VKTLSKASIFISISTILISSISLICDGAWARGGGRSSGGSVNVKGYTNSKGTYVAPYTRKAPPTGSGYSSPYSTSPYTYTPYFNSPNPQYNPLYPYASGPSRIPSYGGSPNQQVHPNDFQSQVNPRDVENGGMGLAYTSEGSVDTFRMYMQWGYTFSKSGQYKDALSWFQKARKLSPQNQEAITAVKTMETRLRELPQSTPQ
jgi:hypothetical protein